jgi:LPS-assembly protein
MPTLPSNQPMPLRLLAGVRRALQQSGMVCALLWMPALAVARDADPVADHPAPDRCNIQAAPDPRLEVLLQADAADEQINVTSDTGEMGRNGDAILSGNVNIRMGQRLLTADAAEINAEKRSVRLQGKVEYLDPTLRVRGQGGSFQDAGIGEFKGAEFELLDRSVRAAAEDARLRAGGRVIELAGVKYTACPPGSDDWQLAAGEISIDQESRIGTGRDVRLDFLGVPIFYTPWISFPVGEQRKSGLLFPTFGNSSKSGTQLAVPYYFNLAPNYDATVTGRVYSSRGVRVDPEFRYLGEDTRGQLNAEYLFHDNDSGDARSLVDWRHVTRLAPRTRWLVDAANVSDQDYFEDFGVGFEGTSVTFVNRYTELRHDTGHWSLGVRAQDYQVIDRDLAAADEPYRILPQLTALGTWQDIAGGLAASLAAEATNFARDAGVEGVRLDAEPTLEWRADGEGAFVAAGAGYRYTHYLLDDVAAGADDSPHRSLPMASLDAGLILERAAGSQSQRLHTLEPRLLYLYVPYRNQDDLPVFDTAIPDLNLVQLFRTNRYVGPDRVSDANQMSVGVTTRLLDARSGRQFLSATLGQAFYFEDPRVRLPNETVRDRSTSDVIAEVDLAAFQSWNARFGYQWNPDLTRTERTEAFVQYAPAPGRVVNAGYRFTRELLEQFDVSGAWPITRQWRGFARWVTRPAKRKHSTSSSGSNTHRAAGLSAW